MTSYLKTTVTPYLVSRFQIYLPYQSREQIIKIIDEYKKYQRIEGILNLAAYILICEKTNKDFSEIRETILLELNFFADSFYIPITKNYYNLLNDKKLITL
jgi:hypothetical protein